MALTFNPSNLLVRLDPRRGTGRETNTVRPDLEASADVTARHGREASGRSVLSNISERFATMRQRERDQDMTRVHARVDLANLANNATQQEDAEAGVGITGTANSGRRPGGNATTPRSRREKEEAASLFGPNLANYFGSGSSTSGAVAGKSNHPPTSPGAVPASTPGFAPGSLPGTLHGLDGSLGSSSGLQRRPRLGSRGRARGASLSGLSTFSGQLDPTESALSLPQQGEVNVSKGHLEIAEGIEIDTLKRWIERSTVGGALEIQNAEDASTFRGDIGNPPTLCSTLQSYVNLKRNTVRLNTIDANTATEHKSEPTDAAASSPTVPQPDALRSVISLANVGAQKPCAPAYTHTIHFEFDCAAPQAAVQVFLRASRKHGLWSTWCGALTSAGFSTDLTLDDDEASEREKYFAQRGMPPHILGWPVHVSKIKKGFGKSLTAGLTLKLDLYAPPGASAFPKKAEQGQDVSLIASDMIAKHVPEASAVPAEDTSHETKEAKVAREKAERETMKMAIIVEALDEDGKTLKEPNLQTTYLRLCSLPVRHPMETSSVHSGTERKVDKVEQPPASVPAQNVVSDEGSSMPYSEQQAGMSNADTTKRAWSVQVEGQEAEIGPHRFQLQELYGLSSRPPMVRGVDDNDDDEDAIAKEDSPIQDGGVAASAGLDMDGSSGGECLICLSSPPTTLLLPCTHGLCLECAVQLRESVRSTRDGERRRGKKPRRKYACPVCRRAYTNMLHLSPADEKSLAQAAMV